MKTTHLLNKVRVTLLPIFLCFSFSSSAQLSYSLWEQNLKDALKTSNPSLIQNFFTDDFGVQEMESWKYEIKRGHLDFNNTKIIRVNNNIILVHIPTNNNAYYGDNHDEYFDFIYRVYRFEVISGKYLITSRCMDEINPDFINYKLGINIHPELRSVNFNCNISLKVRSPHLIIKLAKDFNIKSFEVNNKREDYDRLGYFVHCVADTINPLNLHISGSLRAPDSNNQFMSMDPNCFFLRFGGFAAIPSPPPDNSGRYLFSHDSTDFEITYTYPDNFTLVQYGSASDSLQPNGKMQTKAIVKGLWMDNLSFYAQNNWEKTEIIKGQTHICFYFNKSDKKEQDFITNEVDTLLRWINTKFDNYGKFSINFMVLDKFVKGGLLNDGYSIIAQNAEEIGSKGIGYLHEICHCAPQPQIEGNYLWLKEGFTNFLAFEYLQEQKRDTNFWMSQKRVYLHDFELYEEPLIAITSTSIPTYWCAYQKGPWVFRMLEGYIGKEDFRKALLQIGKMDQIKLKNTSDYFNIYTQISGKDLKEFEKQWLGEKENPVLNVQGQLETKGSNSVVKIKITQDKPFFKLPLEVNINTDKEHFRKIINVEGKETWFEMPVKGKKIKIEYDPDSRLFAVIKDGEKTLTKGPVCNDYIADTLVYSSSDSTKRLLVWFTQDGKSQAIHISDGRQQSILKLGKEAAPTLYISNGDTIFSQDLDLKIIKISNKTFNIAEPVYPYEFIPFIFSMVDWQSISKASLLLYKPERKSCNVAFCKIKERVDDKVILLLSAFFYENKCEIKLNNGLPQEYSTFDGVRYSLVKKAH